MFFELRDATEVLPGAASQLKLLVGKPNQEKKDLGQLREALGKSLDFRRLLKGYQIDEENPISVELPGK